VGKKDLTKREEERIPEDSGGGKEIFLRWRLHTINHIRIIIMSSAQIVRIRVARMMDKRRKND